MKRYWDHSEAERAALTEEQVKGLLAYELMEKGVLAVAPMTLAEVTEVEVPKRRVFALLEANGYGSGTHLGIAFETIENAEACRRSIGFIREQEWSAGAKVRPARNLQIVAEDVPMESDVAARKSALEEKARRERANAEEVRRYEADCKKASDATSNIWADWMECRKAEARHEKIRQTLADYLTMTDGNADLARAFLAKAFPVEEIVEALGPAQIAPTPVKPAPVTESAAASDLPF